MIRAILYIVGTIISPYSGVLILLLICLSTTDFRAIVVRDDQILSTRNIDRLEKLPNNRLKRQIIYALRFGIILSLVTPKILDFVNGYQHSRTFALLLTLLSIAAYFTVRNNRKQPKNLKSFTIFSQLPPELRWKIWEAAGPGVQPLGALAVEFRRKGDREGKCTLLCYRHWPFHQRCDKNKTADKMWLQTKTQDSWGWDARVPALFFVSQEARQILLQNLVVYFWGQWGEKPQLERYFDSTLYAGTFQKLRHIAIDIFYLEPLFDDVYYIEPLVRGDVDLKDPGVLDAYLSSLPSLEFLQRFENLKTLYLVVWQEISVPYGQWQHSKDIEWPKKERLDALCQGFLERQRTRHNQNIPEVRMCIYQGGHPRRKYIHSSISGFLCVRF